MVKCRSENIERVISIERFERLKELIKALKGELKDVIRVIEIAKDE